jgi:pimeloyl-ACP methyl ester carboxylesterase
MAVFDSAGIRLRYLLAGPESGRPIVLVHGYCSDYELNWLGTRWQEALTRTGRLVIGLDCRGHGRSEKPHDPAAYARRTMSDDVARLLDHLDLADADYLGYSMGARIGLDVAVAHSDRIGRVVLGGLGSWSNGRRSELIARRMRGDETVDDPVAEMFYRFAAAREVNDLEALACCILGPQPAPTAGELAGIRVPVAIMAGDLDPIASGGQDLAARIPGSSFVSITGRNHMNAVPARQFKDAALAFLDGSGGRPHALS